MTVENRATDDPLEALDSAVSQIEPTTPEPQPAPEPTPEPEPEPEPPPTEAA